MPEPGDSASHSHVYGVVPPLAGVVTESVTDRPMPTVPADAEMVGAVKVGATTEETTSGWQAPVAPR